MVNEARAPTLAPISWPEHSIRSIRTIEFRKEGEKWSVCPVLRFADVRAIGLRTRRRNYCTVCETISTDALPKEKSTMRTSTFVIQLSASLCGFAALAFAQTPAITPCENLKSLHHHRRRVQRC